MSTCQDCKFFSPTAPETGTCTRYPPHAQPISPSQVTSFWPTVRPNQSCGEFTQRIYMAAELPRELPTMEQ
jgi:hypothetical protein